MGENQGMGLGVLGLRRATARLGGYMHSELRTEVQAGDINLTVIYI